MREVVLVVPPFFSLVRPSLGVSSLKAALVSAQHPSSVLPLNVDFARVIGAELAEWIALDGDYRWLLGEWIFAPLIALPGELPSADAYFAEVATGLPDEMKTQLIELRSTTGAWVTRWAKHIAANAPLLVGFSTSYHQTCAALALAAAVKAQDPAVPIVFGGANCDGTMGAALSDRFPQVDLAVSGEAEHSLVAIVDALKRGEPLPSLIERGAVDDLDTLPTPDVSDWLSAIRDAPFASAVEPGLAVETSRGCWWGMKHHCPFCGVNGDGLRFRRKSSTSVLGELTELAERTGLTRFETSDSILATRLVGGVFDELARRNADYELFFQVRPDLSDDLLVRAARGGLTWIQAGIESLDTELLALLDKGTTRLDVLRFLRSTFEIGLRTIWYQLHGMPDEGSEGYVRIVEMIDDIEHLPPPMAVVPIHLDRFSPLYIDRERYGISDIAPLPAYRHVFALPEDEVPALASLFTWQAPGAADPEVIARLEDRVTRWRARFAADGGPARLELMRLPVGAFVRDTRTSAMEPWCVLNPDELALLSAFRVPQRLADASALTGLTENSAIAAIETLTARRFLVTEGDRGLSVVVEPDRVVHDRTTHRPFPGGTLRTVSGE